MSQNTFLDKILKEFSVRDFKKRFMPMNQVLVLSKNQCFLRHMMSKGHMIGNQIILILAFFVGNSRAPKAAEDIKTVNKKKT